MFQGPSHQPIVLPQSLNSHPCISYPIFLLQINNSRKYITSKYITAPWPYNPLLFDSPHISEIIFLFPLVRCPDLGLSLTIVFVSILLPNTPIHTEIHPQTHICIQHIPNSKIIIMFLQPLEISFHTTLIN